MNGCLGERKHYTQKLPIRIVTTEGNRCAAAGARRARRRSSKDLDWHGAKRYEIPG
jgi:hypothetical protein